MGMLLRRGRGLTQGITTKDSLDIKSEAKVTEVKAESVKGEKPKTVKRGRPTKK